MYSFGVRSHKNLATCHPDLRSVAARVMSWQIYDFAIIWGYRNEEQQMDAFMRGNSTKRWPESKHNNRGPHGEPESLALDFAPWVKLPGEQTYGIPWKDTHAFALIGGLFIAAGAELGIQMRYGGDWDMDGNTSDQSLMDWGHVELRK